jgi:signal transduction histidine kinase
LTVGRMAIIGALAVAGGAAVIAVVLSSHHEDAKVAWTILGPAVAWSFVGTGLYAWHQRPENPTGALMVLLGFAWFLYVLEASNSSLLYTASLVAGGLWGGVFLHLGLSFPSGHLESTRDRALAVAGYVVIPFAWAPALLFAGPDQLDCRDCPSNLILVEPRDDLWRAGNGVAAFLYFVLFVVVLVRSIRLLRGAGRLERQQLTPVYVCALLTFALVTIARAGAGDVAWWAAIGFTSLTPVAFLGGLLRSHVSHLDAELRESLEELRASRARLVHAGDAERRRLERDLHDGAQARLVALALLLRTARSRAKDDADLVALLDRAQEELQTSLAELRELARGIHPAVLTDRGLEPALEALAARVPVPVTLEVEADERLPGPVESAAYFVVSEALANVAKYAKASHATVQVRRVNGRVSVEVADDGIGGAELGRGSGLRGLADRVAALDGTLSVESPPGEGTRLRAQIPCGQSAPHARRTGAPRFSLQR